MSFPLSEKFTGLYATPELVGRKDVLKELEQVLNNPSPKPHVIFFSGRGGIGKTRLLKTALAMAEKYSNIRTAVDVIDFYNTLVHTPLGLTEAIFNVFPPPFDNLRTYQLAYDALTRARRDIDMVELRSIKEEVLRKFDNDMSELSPNKRMVIAFDTAELAVYGLPNWSNEIPFADSWNWLVDHLPRWKHVIIFVAGRDEASLAIEKMKLLRNINVDEIKIGPFNLEESLEYFDNVVRLAKEKNDYHLADRLENMPYEFKVGAHTYSLGRPILLSLLVDYLGFPGEGDIPNIIRYELPKQVTEEDYYRFENELFERLRQGEFGETLIALGRAPKGVNEEILSSLISKDRRPISLEEARKRLLDVQRLSIVKIHSSDQRLFLHDEMYALLHRQVYNSPYDSDAKNQVFDSIKKYYDFQRNLKTQEIKRLISSGLDATEGGWAKRLSESHVFYQNILKEQMYYFLRQDLDRGLRHYYRYSQEAILSSDVLMDMQLQAEVLYFLNTMQSNEYAKDTIGLVLQSLRLRSIARGWAFGEYEKSLEMAKSMLTEVAGEWQTDYPALLASLNIWMGYLYALRGQSKDDFLQAELYINKAFSCFPVQIRKDLESISSDKRENENLLQFDFWYSKAILALGYRVLGYVQRMRGFLSDAIRNYTLSSSLFRQIDLRSDFAMVYNDMGFAQAEHGNGHDGFALAESALNLRYELGYPLPIAFSLNTLASISVKAGEYLLAKDNAEKGLAIFRAYSRGIGLALITLAEATRRYAGVGTLLSVEERIDWLRRARDYAREAVNRFEDGEILRRVEALIELGCACRDWIWWWKEYPRAGDNIDQLAKESEWALGEAALLAKESGLIYKHLDAKIDLVALSLNRLDLINDPQGRENLNLLILEAEDSFPGEDEMKRQPQLWTLKGKLFVIKGNLGFQILKYQRRDNPKGILLEIAETLEEIAINYAWGLENSSRFATDYQGIRQAKDHIFDNLRHLNTDEIRVICRKVLEIFPQQSSFRTFLINRALWVE
ncbi:MAG: ATP-binding protein [Anaerolineaceae bacterium]|nr:MAG: ATP-binding protein [Anaerolineaceae bacterium]